MACRDFVPTLMPMLKCFADKAFRKNIEKQVYENEHMLYDIARRELLSTQLHNRIIIEQLNEGIVSDFVVIDEENCNRKATGNKQQSIRNYSQSPADKL